MHVRLKGGGNADVTGAVFLQSGLRRGFAEDFRVNEQTEAAGEGHGDRLLQDVTGAPHHHASSSAALKFGSNLFPSAGSEDCDSPLSGPDVPPQRACADCSRSAA